MDVKSGKQELTSLITNRKADSYKRRFCYDTLHNFLTHDCEKKVCTLFGLRRTGKTTMMAQAVADIADYEHTCWLYCEAGDEIGNVKRYLREHPEARYVFIDEATRMANFTDAASILADRFAADENRHIVIAGTDSLTLKLALNGELFDRAEVIHTTYIPFREFRYLFGEQMDIDKYIQFGGTLTTENVLYNQQAEGIADYDYTDSAIAHNIQHSLKQFKDGSAFGPLLSFYAAGELTTLINKLVEKDNRSFLAMTINEAFQSHDLGRLRSIVDKSRDFDDVDSTLLKEKELADRVRETLEIKEPLLNKADKNTIAAIKKYLLMLDVIYPLPDSKEVIFTQPGLRFSQVKRLINTLKNDSGLKEGYAPSIREKMWQRIEDSVAGNMMEDIIYAELSKNTSFCEKHEVEKYRSYDGSHEIDIVLLDKQKDEAYLLEVKHSKEYVPCYQARHLISEEACKTICKTHQVSIAGKAVIYRGESKPCTQGIYYFNVNQLLDEPEQTLAQMKSFYLKATQKRPQQEWQP